MSEKIACIRIRGSCDIKGIVHSTLNMLRLYKKNTCSIVNKTPAIEGMLKQAKDYITWGEIDAETEKLLKEKRGKKLIDRKGKEVEKKYFNLNSPKGGFERKGIKTGFGMGGALGYRREKINALIRKMI